MLGCRGNPDWHCSFKQASHPKLMGTASALQCAISTSNMKSKKICLPQITGRILFHLPFIWFDWVMCLLQNQSPNFLRNYNALACAQMLYLFLAWRSIQCMWSENRFGLVAIHLGKMSYDYDRRGDWILGSRKKRYTAKIPSRPITMMIITVF